MIYKPFPYQDYGTNHLLENEKAGLFMEMGLGKTVCTLTAIVELMHKRFDILKVLVIAPLNVANYVWSAEIECWEHLRNLTYSKILGTPAERIKALNKKADIYLINRESIPWLQAYLGGAWPFDMVVIDESSSFKNHKSRRFKALKLVLGMSSRVVLLSGTPAPNSLIDLWSQIYLLDGGERLGTKITGFRQRYFVPGRTNGHIVYNYEPRKETKDNIYKKIGDICISLRSSDYDVLPDIIERKYEVHLDAAALAAYKKFERDAVLDLVEQEATITAVNAAGLSNKLTQFANGAVYRNIDNVKIWERIHDCKIKALLDIIDTSVGQPILIFYWFKHDLQRITAFLYEKKLNYRLLESQKDVDDWKAKKIDLFLLHPASAGHGLNLQAGGNIIIWFGLTWSLELYQQANARLRRTGQKQTVIVHHLVAKGTIDTRIMRAIEGKAAGQNEMMDAIKILVKKYS